MSTFGILVIVVIIIMIIVIMLMIIIIMIIIILGGFLEDRANVQVGCVIKKSRTFTISRWWLQVGYLCDLRGEQSELPGGGL